MNPAVRSRSSSIPDRAAPARGLPCPRCEAHSLVEQERDGVTIDRCTRCRGIWLDRGELERLLEQARADERAAAEDDMPTRAYDRERLRLADDDGDDARRGRRRAWWDLFD